MANAYNQNPILLDTTMASASKVIAGGATTTSPYRILGFWWDAPGTTAGHQVVLQDGAGNQIFSQTIAGATTAGPTNPVMFGEPWVVNDYKLTTLAEGKLYIYLSQND